MKRTATRTDGARAVAALLCLLLPLPAAAVAIRPGEVPIQIGLGVGSGGAAARVKVGYVIHHLLTPFVAAEGQLSTPAVATLTAGVRAHLLDDAAFNPWVEGYGGRLFVGGGLPDATLAGAGAGVLWGTGGGFALSVGLFYERRWFDDGFEDADTFPHLGLRLSL